MESELAKHDDKCSHPQELRVSSQGEEVCGKCAVVISEISSDSSVSDRRQFDERDVVQDSIFEDNRTFATGTLISKSGNDAKGAKIENSHYYERLRKWDHRSKAHTPKSRNLVIALPKIDSALNRLNIPEKSPVRKTARDYYDMLMSHGYLRGNTIEAGCATAVYFAAKKHPEINRTMNDVISATGVSQKRINQINKAIWRREPEIAEEIQTPYQQFDPQRAFHDSVSKIVSRLYSGENNIFQEKIKRRSMDYVGILGYSRQGKSYETVSAAAVYLASCDFDSKYRTTQKEVAAIAGITEVSLRQRSSEISKKIKQGATNS